MELNIRAAQEALANPSDQVLETLQGASSEAQAAVASIAPRSSALASLGKPDGEVAAADGGAVDDAQRASAGGLDGAAAVQEDTARLQVVDEEQHFTSKLPDYMQRWHLYDVGFDYNVVSVLGSQSTGKSTLLNRLYGTTFDVMSESERRQTTKGIWMCRAQGMNILVMDVEGTDGRERGEDQDFERKSALFSLATAEVLLVNMWEHQVGLYQGANMGLLRTVLEVNLGLFQAAKSKSPHAHKDKALLLFVIRDHVGATPLANLAATLRQDLNRIWDSLTKPEGLERSQITDFFDMDFTTLPHKLLQPENFEKEVLNLRKRFMDRKSPDYLFRPIYHKRIPADGFAPYMSNIWQQVLQNKDLDLPTQQELLAQFRCDEIAAGALLAFTEAVSAFRKPIDGGKVLETLGKLMADHRTAALAAFDTSASRYHSGVYQRKRAELMAQMNATLSTLFVSQLTNLQKSIIKRFRQNMLESLKTEGYDFGSLVQEEQKKAERDFLLQASSIRLEDTDWTYDEAHSQLKQDLASIADLLRAEETKKMVVVIERNLKKQLGPSVEYALNKPSSDMWDKVLKAFREALDKAESTYLRKAQSFNCTDEESEEALVLLRKRSWLTLRTVVDEQTSDTVMLIKLKLAFEDKFRYQDGVPRVWRPEDDIDGLFKSAREETLALIPLFARIKPEDAALSFELPDAQSSNSLEDPDFDFQESLVVLTEAKQMELAERFRREADAYFLEAKRSMVSSISQIPVWMYGVIAVLGWNEFITVLRNPLYFTLLLILGAAAFVTVQLNMVGPVTTLARGISNEVYRVANDTLREHFQAPMQRQLETPHQARPSRDTTNGSSSKESQKETESIELKKMQ